MALLFSASGEGNSNLGLFNSSAAVFILLTVLLGNEGFYVNDLDVFEKLDGKRTIIDRLYKAGKKRIMK